jgi:hypothetical protein
MVTKCIKVKGNFDNKITVYIFQSVCSIGTMFQSVRLCGNNANLKCNVNYATMPSLFFYVL